MSRERFTFFSTPCADDKGFGLRSVSNQHFHGGSGGTDGRAACPSAAPRPRRLLCILSTRIAYASRRAIAINARRRSEQILSPHRELYARNAQVLGDLLEAFLNLTDGLVLDREGISEERGRGLDRVLAQAGEVEEGLRGGILGRGGVETRGRPPRVRYGWDGAGTDTRLWTMCGCGVGWG